MEQWEKNFYISAVAGANNGNALVVMSKGMFSADMNFNMFYHYMRALSC